MVDDDDGSLLMGRNILGFHLPFKQWPRMIPNPWIILGVVVALIGASVGGFFAGTHHANLAWQAKASAMQAEAQKLIANRQADIAAHEALDAAHNDKLESDHAAQVAEIVSAHTAFERDLATKLRQSRDRPSCTAAGSPQTPGAGEHQELDPGAIVISGDAARSLGASAEHAGQTESVMAECKAWALEHGR